MPDLVANVVAELPEEVFLEAVLQPPQQSAQYQSASATRKV